MCPSRQSADVSFELVGRWEKGKEEVHAKRRDKGHHEMTERIGIKSVARCGVALSSSSLGLPVKKKEGYYCGKKIII